MANQQPERDGTQVILYAVAGFLAAVGAGFLVAALLSFQSDGSSQASHPVTAATSTPVSTATIVSEVEGSRTTPVVVATAVTPTQQSAEPAATEAAVPEPTSLPDPTETPLPTATVAPAATSPPPPPQPTAEPTATATEEPTPEPSGPFLTITGPSSLEVGESAAFSVDVEPEPLKVVWAYLGQTTAHSRSITMAFPSNDCYTIKVDAIHWDGSVVTGTKLVAVGTGTCP